MSASPLAAALGAALDPVLFARRMGVAPDPWQARVLRSPSRQVILNGCVRSQTTPGGNGHLLVTWRH